MLEKQRKVEKPVTIKKKEWNCVCCGGFRRNEEKEQITSEEESPLFVPTRPLAVCGSRLNNQFRCKTSSQETMLMSRDSSEAAIFEVSSCHARTQMSQLSLNC